ncbi:MAG: DUF4190 domain-containing protein [Firmicutes bacterium]|nr:DUF4190 domain-containing protein [Bacillota bacterium]
MKLCFYCGAENAADNRICATCRRPFAAGTPFDRLAQPKLAWQARASLICGLLAWFPPAAIAAIVFGHQARRRAEKAGLGGEGLALAGLVLGCGGLLLLPLLVSLGVLPLREWFPPETERNEAAAIALMRQLTQAIYTYADSYGQAPPTLQALGPPQQAAPSAEAAGLIEARLAEGIQAGYRFRYQPFDLDGDGKFDTFTLQADPFEPGTSGNRYFFVDTSGVLRAESGRPATASSPPLPR